MSPYLSLEDTSSKDGVKAEFDSASTTYGSETPVPGIDEAESFLPYRGSLSRTSRLKRFVSSPIFAFVIFLTTVSLLGMNIATLILLHEDHHGHKPHHESHGSGPASFHPHNTNVAEQHEVNGIMLNEGETLNEKGLRLAPNGKLLECGSTKAREAKANGCVFDLMSFEWTPPACHDEELLKDAVDPKNVLAPTLAGIFPWGRTADQVFDDPMPQDSDSLSLLSYVWTTEQWHRAHCMYMWRILVKAEVRRLKGDEYVYVPPGATSSEHIEHCNVLISDKSAGNHTALETFRGITSCVRLDKPQANDRSKHAVSFGD